MKITVYVSWDDESIISEKEYQEYRNKEIQEKLADDFAYEEWLSDHLYDHYTHMEVWNLTDKDRLEIRQEYERLTHSDFDEDSDYARVELEI